ncbi:dnaJ homolog subfamily C member 17 isoform X1 [Harpegnathos saltator]|uniref:DnaJ homolog subfamily C member 17 n=1 Tax=Harpegnathos saltator TaxID=610380 RepID=E2BN47_HARSA|nr:dnaJ homolog subfamily C member 17 isoform X1 [Harpegnathos saltator]EFN82951.1 DnaJ-like protein subfamily C member 17 [Harpegnathos saltator]
MDAIMQMDGLYNLIGAEPTASVSEIKKAYRKKALTCHPDKNPNNPKAAELFHELSKALEILTDEKARAAYDQVIAARKQAKERVKEFDAKRRKLKEDLEAREEAYKKTLDPTYNTKSDEERLKVEIERLRKEGSRQVEEEIALLQKQIWEQLHGISKDSESSNVTDFRIKIRWKAQEKDPLSGGYNYDNLHKMFSKYGDVIALVVSSSKKGSAMVEFGDKSAAETALLAEIGLAQNPLTLRGLWDTQKRARHIASNMKPNVGKPIFPVNKSYKSSASSAPDIFTQQRRMDAEFESSVLANLRRAEERKRLIEELKAQEGI